VNDTCRDIDRLYIHLARIAEKEFSDIIGHGEVRKDRLRLHVIDSSFVDVWFSRSIPCKYAFHWERRHIDNTVYRWDNAAHKRIEGLETFPHHFHKGSQRNIYPFKTEETIEETFRIVLKYIRNHIKTP